MEVVPHGSDVGSARFGDRAVKSLLLQFAQGLRIVFDDVAIEQFAGNLGGRQRTAEIVANLPIDCIVAAPPTASRSTPSRSAIAHLFPQPLDLGLAGYILGTAGGDRRARVSAIVRLRASIDSGGVFGALLVLAVAFDGAEQIVDVIDVRFAGDDALILQFFGELLEIGLRTVSHVADGRQDHQGRKMERRQRGHVRKFPTALRAT